MKKTRLDHFVQCSFSFGYYFQKAITELLGVCLKHAECTKKSHWHPILGWVDHAVPSSLLNCISAVKTQIEFLWGPVYLEVRDISVIE